MQGISVLIVTHNRAHLIAETLRSVLAQTYPHFEIIIVDDGSTDHTEEVAGSFKDARIIYYKFPRIGRLSTLRRLAVSKSRFPFIAFIDSDDLWHPSKLEICLQACVQGNYGICIADCAEFGRAENETPSRGHRLNHLPEVDIGHELLINNVALSYGSNLFFKKELYDRGIQFNERFPFSDHDFMVRAVFESSAVYIPQVLTYIRKHEGNMSSSRRPGVIAVLEFNRTLLHLRTGNFIPDKIYKKLCAKNYYFLAGFYLQHGQKKHSLKNLAKALGYAVDLKAIFHYSKLVLMR